MKAHLIDTHRLLIPRSRSNIKGTFLKKWRFGGVSVSKTHLVSDKTKTVIGKDRCVYVWRTNEEKTKMFGCLQGSLFQF